MPAGAITRSARRWIEDIDVLIAGSQARDALYQLKLYWQSQRTQAAAATVLARFAKLSPQLSGQITKRTLFIGRSFTVEPIVGVLKAEAMSCDIDLRVEVGRFNMFAQEILDPASPLYTSEPDVILMATELADLRPDLRPDPAEAAQGNPPRALDEILDETIGSWSRLLVALRERSRASVLVQNWTLPSAWESDVHRRSFVDAMNQRLADAVERQPGMFLIDYRAMVAAAPPGDWYDLHRWHAVGLPLTSQAITKTAQAWVRHIVPLSGGGRKALVVDLDNTLWPGIAGEQDLLSVDFSTVGPEYLAVQAALKELARRGILLAIASKNNRADALRVLDNHPQMIVRSNDFSADRINWNPKVASIREIATALHIGIDAIAFLDDDAVERQAVRQLLPDVLVLDPPSSDIGQFLRDLPAFHRLKLSDEDRMRTDMFQAEKRRSALQESSTTLSDFLGSLQMKARLFRARPVHIARLAQLAQRTNQCNLTTIRYSEQDLESFLERPDVHVYGVQSSDRFGDHGIVGLCVVKHGADDRAEIESLLFSCRVIGRGLETALLASVARHAADRNTRQLSGWFRATSKNAPARDVYSQHDFELETRDGDDGYWTLDLTRKSIQSPEWIHVEKDT